MAVEDREQADQAHGDGDRRLDAERDDGAEHDDRGGNAGFDHRYRHAGHRERAADRHGEDEGRGHQPQRAAAELPGEDADGDHRKNVIEPAQRVREAMGESVHLADAGMRQGGGRHEREGGGDGQALIALLGSAHGGSPLAALAAGKIIGANSHIEAALRKGIGAQVWDAPWVCLPWECLPRRARPVRGERLRRHHHHAAVAHAALGDHVLGEVLHGAGLALEHCDLHATVMVEMDMQRRQRQFVMIVEGLGQALGQLARGVVVDVDQGGDAVALGVQGFAGLADAGAGEVADRLGAVLVAAGGDDAVELGHQLVIDGDGHALHASLANWGCAPRPYARPGTVAHGRPSTGAGHGWTARGPALRLLSVLVRSRPLANASSMPAPPAPAAAAPPPRCRHVIHPSCRTSSAALAATQKQARPDEIRAGRFDRRGGGWGRSAPIATGGFFGGAGRGPWVAAVGPGWKRSGLG